VEGQGLLSSAVILSGDVLSRLGLLRPFEQRVRELLGLDMFSVRTQVIQNLVTEKVLGLESPNPLTTRACPWESTSATTCSWRCS